jgi:hypothetical protein
MSDIFIFYKTTISSPSSFIMPIIITEQLARLREIKMIFYYILCEYI